MKKLFCIITLLVCSVVSISDACVQISADGETYTVDVSGSVE